MGLFHLCKTVAFAWIQCKPSSPKTQVIKHCNASVLSSGICILGILCLLNNKSKFLVHSKKKYAIVGSTRGSEGYFGINNKSRCPLACQQYPHFNFQPFLHHKADISFCMKICYVVLFSITACVVYNIFIYWIDRNTCNSPPQGK